MGAMAILSSAGLKAVKHSSGSYIFTQKAGGYIAGTIGRAVVAPLLIKTTVVVGGAVLVFELTCAPINHPDAIQKVRQILLALETQLREAGGSLGDLEKAAIDQVRTLNNQAIDQRDAGAKKLSNANQVAIDYRDAALGYFSFK